MKNDEKKPIGVTRHEAEVYLLDGEKLLEYEHQRIFFSKQFLYNHREMAAVAYVLLSIIESSCMQAPYPASKATLGDIRDCLTSICDPNLNGAEFNEYENLPA